MPFPTLLSLAFVTGIGAALAGRGEIRNSPKPPWLSYSFGAYVSFLSLVLVPISVYFYLFHGDWFLLYLVDVGRVPSALAMTGFFGQAAMGCSGFLIGAAAVRTRRETLGGLLVVVVLFLAALALVLLRQRLAVVGNYAQFQTGLGLLPYGRGALWQGTIAMGVLLFSGLAYLLVRLYLSVCRVA
ncbi:MAG: hypothetical protein AAFU56_07555 [Pseudomonadota bacterium]